jgi:hypothetical protein
MDRIDLTSLLANATKDTIVYLRYRAGHAAGPQAVEEFNAAKDWKVKPDEYIGHFVELSRNRRQELVLTLFVHNRGETGALRKFNPKVGTLLEAKIVSP